MKTIGIIGPSVEANELFLGELGDEGQTYYHHLITPENVRGKIFDEVIEHPQAKKNQFYKKIKELTEQNLIELSTKKYVLQHEDIIQAVRDFNKFLIDTKQMGLKGQDAKQWASQWINKRVSKT